MPEKTVDNKRSSKTTKTTEVVAKPSRQKILKNKVFWIGLGAGLLTTALIVTPIIATEVLAITIIILLLVLHTNLALIKILNHVWLSSQPTKCINHLCNWQP